MDAITTQYCSEITKGSFYNTPAMSLIDTGSSTPEELNNKYVNEQDNTDIYYDGNGNQIFPQGQVPNTAIPCN